jgi:hypothetical protein
MDYFVRLKGRNSMITAICDEAIRFDSGRRGPASISAFALITSGAVDKRYFVS